MRARKSPDASPSASKGSSAPPRELPLRRPDGDREAWEDQAPARGYDDYEAQMDVTCFCCYSAKPDLR